MPDVRPNVTYTVTFTSDQFRILGLALAGKIKTGSRDAKAADALNIELLKVRAAYIADLKKVCDGALEKALAEVGEQTEVQQESGLHEH